jgi:uncharacterized protein YkwD
MRRRNDRLVWAVVIVMLIVFVVVVGVVVATLISIQPQIKGARTGFMGAEIVTATNIDRGLNQLKDLKVNDRLTKTAQAKADDMASRGYFAHTTPEGKQFFQFMQDQQYSYCSAGENLAVDYITTKSVEKAWMNSTSHRANILTKDYKDIGVGIAKGRFEGHNATFIAVEFGNPTNFLNYCY